MKKFLVDKRGYFFYGLRKLSLIFKKSISTLFMRLELALKGIILGKGVVFFGRSRFNRHHESRIIIGKKCLFRSDKNSNLAGISKSCLISTLRKNAELIIGDNCGISGATIGTAHRIIIGKNCLIGANTFITDFDWHNTDPELRHQVCNEYKPVVIGDNVWLGINTIVLKGITIGENSVIGANSVVVKDIPANVIAAGNPCKVIKELS